MDITNQTKRKKKVEKLKLERIQQPTQQILIDRITHGINSLFFM